MLKIITLALIVGANIALAAEKPNPLSAEDKLQIVQARENFKDGQLQWVTAQAKINNCSNEIVQKWREDAQEAQQQMRAAQATIEALKNELIEQYDAKGWTVSNTFEWVKEPEEPVSGGDNGR